MDNRSAGGGSGRLGNADSRSACCPIVRGEFLFFSEDPAWELKRREVALWSSNEDGGTGVYQ